MQQLWPSFGLVASLRSCCPDTLLIYHNGHETETCTPNYDGVVDHFNEIGYDVMEMMMPLIGCNQARNPSPSNPSPSAWAEPAG